MEKGVFQLYFVCMLRVFSIFPYWIWVEYEQMSKRLHTFGVLQGAGEMGKYTCLICQKEFSSESGVKYHISKTHSQVGPSPSVETS